MGVLNKLKLSSFTVKISQYLSSFFGMIHFFLQSSLLIDAPYKTTIIIIIICSTYLPMMEYAEAEDLALCMCTEISLKAERVDGWNEGFDDVEWRAGDRGILGHMTSVNRHKELVEAENILIVLQTV